MVELNSGDQQKISEISGLMRDEELQWIVNAASRVNSWTEVGVYHGKSAFAVGLCLPSNSLLQLVDTNFCPEFYKHLEWFLSRRPDLAITITSAKSEDAARFLRDTDGVFIDDDHTYEGVCTSVRAWRNKCHLFCGHDYTICTEAHFGVKKAVDELCPKAFFPVPSGSIWVRK